MANRRMLFVGTGSIAKKSNFGSQSPTTIVANHRRRIKTEEKAKVVAAVCGTELIQFLAVLDIFHQDDFEEKG